MGWFSPVKGSYPSLAQIDKTLPVKDGNDTIKRGSIITPVADDVAGDYKSDEGVWKLATGSEKMLFVALQDYSDPTAGFAGTSFTPNPTANHPARPAITGIDLAMDGEYETSVFDTTKTYAVGDTLYVANGVLTNVGSGTVVGYVTRPSIDRWINNAIATPPGQTDQRLATRTGAKMAVLRFKTAV